MEQSINKDDYLSIGDFAKLSGISRKNLIYYDTIGVFSPEITLENGYRFYYYRQLYTINMICTLKDIGVPLKTIKEYTENRSPEKLIELFESQLQSVDTEINRLTQTREMMLMHLETSRIASRVKTDVIEIQHLDDEPIFVGKKLPMIEGQRVTFSKMLTAFYQYAYSQGYQVSFPWGIKVDFKNFSEDINLDDFQNSPDIENNLSFYYHVPISDTYKPAGKYIVLYTYNYNKINSTYQQMRQYALKHNYRIKKEIYEDYLVNEISANKPEDYLIRLTIPIE
jgi:Predicted transcriptional regulators